MFYFVKETLENGVSFIDLLIFYVYTWGILLTLNLPRRIEDA
jgi:hypothetical protein